MKKVEKFGHTSSIFNGRENELRAGMAVRGLTSGSFFQTLASQQSFSSAFTGSDWRGYGGTFHPGLDVRALSQRIKDLKLAGRSIEEIAKEIDPKEFENMWR